MMGWLKSYGSLSLAILVFCMLNISFVEVLNVYDTQRIAQLGFGFCLSLVMLFAFERDWVSRFSVAPLSRFFFVILLALFIFSSYNSVFPEAALKEGFNTILLLLTLIFLSIASSSNAKESLVLAVSVGLLLYFFQMLVAFSAGVLAGTTIEREVIVHHISNIRFINHIQVLTLPIIVVFSLHASSKSVRSLCVVVAVLSVSVLLFLSARAALGSLLIASGILFVLKPDAKLIKRSIVILMSGFVLYLVVFKFIPLVLFSADIAQPRVNLNSSGRWDMWVESLYIIKENWLLGVGPMHYGYWSQYGFGHPHNLPLQIAIEYGLPFFLIVCFGVGSFTVCLFKLFRNGSMNEFEFACFWAYFAIGGVSLFSGVWVAPLTQLMLILILSPLLALVIRARDEESQPVSAVAKGGADDFDEPKTIISHWIIRLVVLVSIAFLAKVVVGDIDAKLSGKIIDPNAVEKPLYAPRFWQEDYWPKRE